ncbi:hypothetical protein ONZ45_g5511 [Pleurotus djamor]|nr:hypothetical protein ONZ45_g5511 [Pleurotus djamor]
MRAGDRINPSAWTVNGWKAGSLAGTKEKEEIVGLRALDWWCFRKLGRKRWRRKKEKKEKKEKRAGRSKKIMWSSRIPEPHLQSMHRLIRKVHHTSMDRLIRC